MTARGTAADWPTRAVAADDYRRREPLFRALAVEAQFAIEHALKAEGVKTHSVTYRVKEFDSLADKAERKGYADPFTVTDFAALRIVLLFLSDIGRVGALLRETFEVLQEDDKIEGGAADSFSYMSVHYLCQIKADHAGPRYDPLKGLTFEVQVRTILMDAWANVSHHLAYKGESSIPERLRRDFHALAGLLYVADQHFQLFFGESLKEQAVAAKRLAEAKRLSLNLDTMMSFLRARYADRVHLDRDEVGKLVDELLRYGIHDLDTLAALLDAGAKSFGEYEETRPLVDGGRYADVGAVRMTLAAADPQYERWKFGDISFFHGDNAILGLRQAREKRRQWKQQDGDS